MSDLNDLFREEEERALAATREEMAKEQAAFDALPEEEKQRIRAEHDAKFCEMFGDADPDDECPACWDCGEVIDPEDDDGEGYCPDCRVDHEDE